MQRRERGRQRRFLRPAQSRALKIENFHAEDRRTTGDLAADFAEADDAERRAMQRFQSGNAGGIGIADPRTARADGKPARVINPARGIGAKAIVLSTTVVGGRLIVWGVRRKYGEAPALKIEKAFSYVNFSFAAAYVAVGGHNLSLK